MEQVPTLHRHEIVRSETIERAQIGGGLRCAPSGSYFPTGKAAIGELDKDIRMFRSELGGHGGRRKEVMGAIEAYRELIIALLDLHPEAALTTGGCVGYIPEMRREGYSDSYETSLGHHVLVPYLPGGFLRAQADVTIEDGEVTIGDRCWQDYFCGDSQGSLADYHDSRNDAAAAILCVYMNHVSGNAWRSYMNTGSRRRAAGQ